MNKSVNFLMKNLFHLIYNQNNKFINGFLTAIILQNLVTFIKNQSNRVNLIDILRLIPSIDKKVKDKLKETQKTIQDDINKVDSEYQIVNKLEDSKTIDQILNKIDTMRTIEWQDGKISGIVYHGEDSYRDFLLTIFKKYAWSNPLHPDLFPEIRNMEIDIINMTIDMFKGDKNCCGNVTYGGTESILLACKTYRDWAFQKKGITKPNIVILESGHAAFNKAGDYFGIEIRTVPIDLDLGTAPIEKIKEYVDWNTICLVGSAPSYAHGIIDDIYMIAEYADSKNIGFHLDCCMGGFLVPFLYDSVGFNLKGVTSISADTHKYGYTFKGSSVILYKNMELKNYQHFSKVDWNGGIYATPTLMGSKSGALIATTWAAMMYHGKNKYTQIANQIQKLTLDIINKTGKIEGIKIIGQPYLNIVAYQSDGVDIYQVASKMKEKGWDLSIMQNPPSFHICITKLHINNDLVDNFTDSLKKSVILVKEEDNPELKGTVAIYGMASTINQPSLVQEVTNSYLNLLSKKEIV